MLKFKAHSARNFLMQFVPRRYCTLNHLNNEKQWYPQSIDKSLMCLPLECFRNNSQPFLRYVYTETSDKLK